MFDTLKSRIENNSHNILLIYDIFVFLRHLNDLVFA